MIAMLATLFYLAGFVSAGHGILSARTAQGAIAWSVSLISMPFVAVPAYVVFGRNKFEVTAIIAARTFAADMEDMFQRDFEHSLPIDPATFDDKALFWRLGEALSRLAAPVL